MERTSLFIVTNMNEDDDLDVELSSYSEYREQRLLNKKQGETSLYSLLLLLGIVIVLMIGTSAIVCFTDETCKHRIPTMNNLLNSTFTAPFLVTGVNAAIGAHVLVVIGVYYRTRLATASWSRIQVLFALATYMSAGITLFVSAKTGWAHDWANVGTVIVLGCWMVCTQMALRSTYSGKIGAPRKLLIISLAICILYCILSIIYVVLRAVPVQKYVSEKNKHVGMLISEILSGITLVGYVTLAVLHTRRIKFTLFYKPNK